MQYLLSILLPNPFMIFIFWMIASLSILGISLEILHRFKYDFATSLLISALVILNILYWVTFFNFFIFQITIFVLGGSFLLKRRELLIQNKIEYMFITICILWCSGICMNTIPFSWDEFFWTLFDQHINQYSNYWKTNSAILLTHIRYLPGSALWHNFFGLKNQYNEATAYFANSVLLIIVINWFISKAIKKNKFVLFCLLFLSLGCFSEGWFTLYVDPWIGLTMGISLVSMRGIFKDEKDGSFVVFILAMACNILFKETGIVSFIAISGTTLAAYLLHLKNEISFKKLLVGLFYCLCIFLSWKLYQKYIGARNPISINEFLTFNKEQYDYRIKVLVKFLKYCISSYIMLPIWLLTILIAKTYAESSRKLLLSIFVLLLVFGFVGIHLINWLFMTVPSDGLSLSAAARYMGSMLLCLFIFYSVSISSIKPFSKFEKGFLIFILVWVPVNLLWVGIKPSALFELVTPHPKQVPIARLKLAELRDKMPKNIKSMCYSHPSKIWFIYQNSNGYEAMLARHLLTPCQVSYGSWSLGAPYYKDDMWTANYSDENFLNQAEQYPWLILVNIDEQFNNKYGHFFEGKIETKTLYEFNQSLKKYEIIKIQ